MSQSEERESRLKSYRALLSKIDGKFAEIQSAYPSQFSCRKACYQCCAADLTVFQVEKDAIRSYLQARPSLQAKLAKLARDNPHEGRHCKFLNDTGECLIYPVRPVICRSHGAPIKFSALPTGAETKEEERKSTLDVCPLNFQELDLADLPSAMLVNLDTLNTLLSLINAAYSQNNQGKRFCLNLQEIMQN